MNSDGWGFLGAGASDKRQAGEDLQHNKQTRTADENPTGEQRMVRQPAAQGGPMKEHMDKMAHESRPMKEHLSDEKTRHDNAKEHHMKHLERHHSRPFNSQHGQDTHKHNY